MSNSTGNSTTTGGDHQDLFADFKYYHYNPSMAAAIVFIILFLATSAVHTWQLAKRRTWYFIPFLLGGFFEWIGYIGRALSAKETPNWTLGPYIMQTLLLLVAPALFAASIYMVLGRIIRLTDGERCSLIRSKWLTKIFVAGDVISFLAQSGGGGMLAQAKTESAVQTGNHIIVGGLVVQVLFFGLFVIVASVFHVRINRNPTTRSASIDVPWARFLYVLYAASVFIMIRSIFRVAEYTQGNDGTLLGHEVYLYVFDACLMFFTMVLFNVWHPSRIIPRGGRGDAEAGVGYMMPGRDVPNPISPTPSHMGRQTAMPKS
ncbi:hypothetical protein H2203_008835 [Taxawa tesnikishii (nom. ined.)]|nr:hypothetical protein H2203_008835 [Dothideales sp. JES 119]